MYTRKHPLSDRFVQWATDIVFTHHMGNQEQKQKLMSKAMHVSLDTVKTVFDTSLTALPIIYIISLGSIRDVSKVLSIENAADYPQYALVLKFGRSDDGKRRMGEHNKTFTQMGINPIMKMYTIIDPMYISQAESLVAEFFTRSGSILPVKSKFGLPIFQEEQTKKEIGYLLPSMLVNLQDKMDAIRYMFSGKTSELQNELHNKETHVKGMFESFSKDLAHKERIIEEKERANQREREMRKNESEKYEMIIEEKERANQRVHEMLLIQ